MRRAPDSVPWPSTPSSCSFCAGVGGVPGCRVGHAGALPRAWCAARYTQALGRVTVELHAGHAETWCHASAAVGVQAELLPPDSMIWCGWEFVHIFWGCCTDQVPTRLTGLIVVLPLVRGLLVLVLASSYCETLHCL